MADPSPWRQRAARVRASAAAAVGAGVLAHWITTPRNFGDLLTPLLIEAWSARVPVCANGALVPPWRSVVLGVGSILGNRAFAGPRRHVWGSGFIASGDTMPMRPARVHAVRGPLTRAALHAQGIACPNVLGDPALLLPRIVPARATGEFALGVIPHYVHRDHPAVARWRARDDVLVLDVAAEPRAFIRDLHRCRAVASSSLHGLITADAYGIPNVWVTFGPGLHGDGFKFADYFASVARPFTASPLFAPDTTPDALAAAARATPLSLDLDALEEACPFRDA